MIKPFKIKVESKSHSREIQEWLFSLGYRWWSMLNEPVQEVKIHEHKFLYFSKALADCDPTLSVANNPEFFDSLEIPEMWFYDGKLQDRPKKQLLTYRDLIQAQLDGKTVQYYDYLEGGVWVDFQATMHKFIHSLDEIAIDTHYRIKPNLKRICNGVELDPCLTEAPELGANYYYPDPMHVDYYNLKPWAGDADDVYWFELGFAYGSSESAAKHGQAMGITTER